jgi:hypothetical protein
MENLQNIVQSITLCDDRLPSELKLSESGRYTTYYAPFEHINASAKVVICGITPGIQQAMIALKTTQAGLQRGLEWAEALQEAKASSSFAGSMRKNLAMMLDYIGLNQYLKIEACSGLFGAHNDFVHYTSALRNPVLDAGKNYSGGRSMTTNEYLWNQALNGLKEEIAILPNDAVFIPLGTGVDEVFRKLINLGLISSNRVLFGLPHASGANSERIAYFCEKKERSALSTKTNPDTIEEKRDSLVKHVAHLILQVQTMDPIAATSEVHAEKQKLRNDKMKIEYRVARGKQAGSIFTPHQNADGFYIVSKTRFEEDQVEVTSLREIKQYLDRGYSVRMSDPMTRRSPTLITPASITVSD